MIWIPRFFCNFSWAFEKVLWNDYIRKKTLIYQMGKETGSGRTKSDPYLEHQDEQCESTNFHTSGSDRFDFIISLRTATCFALRRESLILVKRLIILFPSSKCAFSVTNMNSISVIDSKKNSWIDWWSKSFWILEKKYSLVFFFFYRNIFQVWIKNLAQVRKVE